MKLEQERGISSIIISSQFEYREKALNLLDTPGHADFSRKIPIELWQLSIPPSCSSTMQKGLKPEPLNSLKSVECRNLPYRHLHE